MKIQNGISLTAPTPEAKTAQLDGQLRDASKMYETYFLNQMVKAMRSTVNREEGVMQPNFAEKIFSEQLDQQYVEGWAEKGGVGLADMIYSQISEKFQGAAANRMGGPMRLKGTIPIAPKKDPHGISTPDSIQMKAIPPSTGAKMEYRFEVPQNSGSGFEALAPMDGKVMNSERLADGWNNLRLDHGQGVSSELTFPGQAPQIEVGSHVEAGRKLGLLDPSRPVMAWKLDWT